MRTFLILYLSLMLLAGCSSVLSNDLAEQYQIGRTVKPAKVDGTLDPGEWNSAQKRAPVQITSGAGTESTSIRLMYDKDFLYLGIRCVDSQITERNADLRKNDSIQARIRIGVAETDDSFQFRLSAIPQGLVSARFHKGPTPDMREDRDITKPLAPNLYKAACTVDDTGWSMEFALSWSAIRPLPTPPAPFHLFVERRNINGNKIEVADWPYDKKVEFQFERPTDNKETPTKR